MALTQMLETLTRRNTQIEEGVQRSTDATLIRVLGLADLTLLGVGTTLGLGVYVTAGSVIKNDAGPAVSLSFLIAAIASALAGLCYAEFAGRVPKAGSVYTYTYVTVGELAAFFVGWDLILEYIIGTAGVARGLTNYLDKNLLNESMSKALTDAMPINVSWLSPYPDLLALGIVLILSILLAWGVKESSLFNNTFTAVNLLTVAMILLVGVFYMNIENWALDPLKESNNYTNSTEGNSDHNAKLDHGGFMPFGVSGVMSGAAKCFYAFVGFDAIAATGAEAKNPKRDIPLAIIICLIICFLAYSGVSSVLTLMLPYYLQDSKAAVTYAFGVVGVPEFFQWIVTGGAVFALFASLLGGMFPLPRVVYAMAHDGMLFEVFSKISPSRNTPVIATLVTGIFSGVMAALFDVNELMDMMSIGTLLAYSIMAICVLVLRYQDPNPMMEEYTMEEGPMTSPLQLQANAMKTLKNVFNLSLAKYPNKTTEVVSYWAVAVYTVLVSVFCITLVNMEDLLVEGSAMAITPVCLLVVAMLLTVFILNRQPQSRDKKAFRVPLLPLIPCLSICINFYLMTQLNKLTWIRFSIWLIIGMSIYVFYSIPHSKVGKRARDTNNKVVSQQC